MSSDPACPWNWVSLAHGVGSGCQLCPSLCVILAWGVGVQVSPSQGQWEVEEQLLPKTPDPAGSPKGWDLPGDITECCPMHMSLLLMFTSVPRSHVPHGVGAVAPMLPLGRLRPGPRSVPLVLTHREHTASVETAPGTGAGFRIWQMVQYLPSVGSKYLPSSLFSWPEQTLGGTGGGRRDAGSGPLPLRAWCLRRAGWGSGN